ncbi:hypothetical protein [Streptomyces spongiae]|uniref:hypothetical protein n=1 Tax=Streptomyces spongiae TaxID=565072 RepID=UPI00128B7765|nr:hypothetical protein [Streptomyces spongiae]
MLRRSGPSAAKDYVDWKLDDRAGRPLAVRGFLLVRARVGSRLAARAASSSASLSSSRANSLVFACSRREA